MDNETRERIEKEAKEYCHTRGEENCYIKGATAEHSRITELLKEEKNKAIDSVKDMLVVMMEDEENEGLAALENAYRKLESLKGKQQ